MKIFDAINSAVVHII